MADAPPPRSSASSRRPSPMRRSRSSTSPEDDDHFSAIVTSRAFTGLSKLKQHQLVYKAIGSHMGGTLHALQLQTLEPAG